MADFFEECANEVRRLRADLQAVGKRTWLEIQSSDPELTAELEAALEGSSAAWLVIPTASFGGKCAVELLAAGNRAQVLQVLHNLHYGLGA
jgi:hypothetical protein